MALADFVNVQISLTAQSVTRPGFGTPLILAADAPGGFNNRVRVYNTVDDLVTDGFSVSGPTYLMASELLAQNPSPPSFKVGRLALKPTQHFTITPTAVNNTVYGMTVGGQHVSFTSDGSATAAKIVTGLAAAIAALGSPPDMTTGGTSTLTLVANSAGEFFDCGVDDVTLLSIVQDHTDPGAATDLAAILLEDSDWYALLNAFNSLLMVDAIAAWAETNKKLFLFQTIDTPVVTASPSGATDVVAVQKTNARFWTSGWYSPNTGDFLDAAMDGAMLPTDPGSEMWGLQSVSGVAPSKLTATQRSNVLGKNGNLYEVDGGVQVSAKGNVGSGEWIDVVRFRDWLSSEMQADVFDALRSGGRKKIPFTDAGIAAVEGAIRGTLKRGIAAGGLSDNPAPKVIVPLASSFTSGQRATRTLTGVYWDAVLAGAIIAVTPIKGVLTD